MAVLTHLTKAQIQRFLKNYSDLENLDFSVKGLQDGTVNSIYRLNFKKGPTVYLKVDEVANEKRLKQEFRLLNFLKSHQSQIGFSLPIPIKQKSGPFFSKIKNKPVYLLPEVDGHFLKTKDLKTTHIQQVAKALKELHALKVPKSFKKHTWHLRQLQSLFKRLRPKILKMDKALHEKIKTVLTDLQKQNLKTKPALLHADLFFDNIHWQKNKLTGILDFEYAGLGLKEYDLSLTFLALCWENDVYQTSKGNALLNMYYGKNVLSATEKRRLRYGMQHAAITIVLTRLMTFEFGKLPTRGPQYRSYLEFLKRLDWVELHFSQLTKLQ